MELWLVCFLAGCIGINWIFGEHHVATPNEFDLFIYSAASTWLFLGGLSWLMYIAFEPFVRRRWPGMLVGWNRLLAGGYRDPLVGRDLLAGCAAGVLVTLLGYFVFPAAFILGSPQPRPLGAGTSQMPYLLSGIHAAIVDRFEFHGCFHTCWPYLFIHAFPAESFAKEYLGCNNRGSSDLSRVKHLVARANSNSVHFTVHRNTLVPFIALWPPGLYSGFPNPGDLYDISRLQ